MTLELTLTLILALLVSSGRAHAQANTFLDATVGPQPTTGFRVSVATAPITASFTFSPSSGAWPLTVQFVDTTQGGPASWAWDFGDGSTSTSQNPAHTYYYPSTFIVTLYVSGAGGIGLASHTLSITNPACPAILNISVNQQVTVNNQIRSQALVFGNDNLFMCTRATPSTLIRWSNPNNLSSYQTVTFSSDGFHNRCLDMTYDQITGLLLLPFPTVGKLTLSTVDPNTLSVVDVVTNSSLQSASSVCSDGSNAYISGSDPVSGTLVVCKYRMSDWSLQNQVWVTNAIPVGAIRYDGTNLYGNCSTIPGEVYRINLPSMTYSTNSVPLPYSILTDDLSMYGSYLYLGSEQSTNSVGAIVRVKKDDLSVDFITNCLTPGNSFSMYYGFPNVGNPYQGTIWDAVPSSPSVLVGLNPVTLQMWKATLPSGINTLNEVVSDGTQLFASTYTDPPQVVRISATQQPVPVNITFPAGTLVEANSNISTHMKWNGLSYAGFMLRTGNGNAPMMLFVYDALGNTNQLTLTGMTYNLAGAHPDFAFNPNSLVLAGCPATTSVSNSSVFEYSITPGYPLPTGLTLITNFSVGDTNCRDAVVTSLSSGGFAVGFSKVLVQGLDISYRSPSGTWTNLGNIGISSGGGAAPYIAAAQIGGTSNWWIVQNWDGGNTLWASEWTTSGGLNKVRDFRLCDNTVSGGKFCWGAQAPYGENCIMEMISDTVSNRLILTYSNDHFGDATLISSVYAVVCGLQSGVSAFNPASCGSVDTNNFYLLSESDTAVIIDFNPLGIAQSGSSLMSSRLQWNDDAFNTGNNPLDCQKGTPFGFSPSSRIRTSSSYSQMGFADHHFDILYNDISDNKWHLLIGL